MKYAYIFKKTPMKEERFIGPVNIWNPYSDPQQ